MDRDGDGLIEIDSLLMLHNMRYNMSGSSYKVSADSDGYRSGCPSSGCRGYELTGDLDFDADGDGSTWSGDKDGGYSLDADDSEDDYFPVIGDGRHSGNIGGWNPIGGEDNYFNAIFEGNGYTIRNLAIRGKNQAIGFFSEIGDDAEIRNIGLIDSLADYIGFLGYKKDKDWYNHIGGLVGKQFGGTIKNSYVTGAVDGHDYSGDNVGGLVGRMKGGSIENSWATVTAAGQGPNIYKNPPSIGGTHRDPDRVGGLVGLQVDYASIRDSYATGAVYGSNENDDHVGGLVGRHENSTVITGSYATGAVYGGSGDNDHVGGLVGRQDDDASIAASWATGAADGGSGNSDNVGGLVGWQRDDAVITASYATGAAAGGSGAEDVVGGLVGLQEDDAVIAASYATGAADGGVHDHDRVGGLVGRQKDEAVITASYATGAAAGGGGGSDRGGSLVGQQDDDASITASYGFGRLTGVSTSGWALGSSGTSKPSGVDTAAQLTAANAGSSWNDAGSNTRGAWDLGTNSQNPLLNYADYDGDPDDVSSGNIYAGAPLGGGYNFDCDDFPTGTCGNPLPGQGNLSFSGPSAEVELGAVVSLAGSLGDDRLPIESSSWQQLSGPVVALSDAAAHSPTFTMPDGPDFLVFELTATDGSGGQYRGRITIAPDVDSR